MQDTSHFAGARCMALPLNEFNAMIPELIYADEYLQKNKIHSYEVTRIVDYRRYVSISLLSIVSFSHAGYTTFINAYLIVYRGDQKRYLAGCRCEVMPHVHDTRTRNPVR